MIAVLVDGVRSGKSVHLIRIMNRNRNEAKIVTLMRFESLSGADDRRESGLDQGLSLLVAENSSGIVVND